MCTFRKEVGSGLSNGYLESNQLARRYRSAAALAQKQGTFPTLSRLVGVRKEDMFSLAQFFSHVSPPPSPSLKEGDFLTNVRKADLFFFYFYARLAFLCSKDGRA